MFILHSLERLELKFGLSSEFFDKVPVRILLDVLFRVFRFSKASFCALTLDCEQSLFGQSRSVSHV